MLPEIPQKIFKSLIVLPTATATTQMCCGRLIGAPCMSAFELFDLIVTEYDLISIYNSELIKFMAEERIESSGVTF